MHTIDHIATTLGLSAPVVQQMLTGCPGEELKKTGRKMRVTDAGVAWLRARIADHGGVAQALEPVEPTHDIREFVVQRGPEQGVRNANVVLARLVDQVIEKVTDFWVIRVRHHANYIPGMKVWGRVTGRQLAEHWDKNLGQQAHAPRSRGRI